MMGNLDIDVRQVSDGYRAYVYDSEDGDTTLYVSPPCATEEAARADAKAWVTAQK